MNWENEKVIICGGAGLIGSYLAMRLEEFGAEVIVFDDFSSGSELNLEDFKGKIIEKDLRFERSDYFADADWVFQCAADMGGIGYITAIGADIMYNSAMVTMNCLESVKYRDNLKGFFYCSSACIYPEYKQLEVDVPPLKESDAMPAQPDQFYGWEKLFAEKLCEAYRRDYGVPTKVARFHNIYGPVYTAFDKDKGKAPCHTISKVIMLEDGQNILVWGDGKQTRSFMYIDDCVNAILRLMEVDHNEPINIGSDEMVTIDQLTEMVIKISGKKLTIIHDETKPQGVRGRNADLTLFEEVLGFRPETKLYQGLERTYDWAVERWNEI